MWYRAKIVDNGREAFTPYIEADNMEKAQEIAEREYGKGYVRIVEEVAKEDYSLFEE